MPHSPEAPGSPVEEAWTLPARLQRNLRSRSYTAGRYSVRRENGVHHFHEMLRRMLAE